MPLTPSNIKCIDKRSQKKTRRNQDLFDLWVVVHFCFFLSCFSFLVRWAETNYFQEMHSQIVLKVALSPWVHTHQLELESVKITKSISFTECCTKLDVVRNQNCCRYISNWRFVVSYQLLLSFCTELQASSSSFSELLGLKTTVTCNKAAALNCFSPFSADLGQKTEAQSQSTKLLPLHAQRGN